MDSPYSTWNNILAENESDGRAQWIEYQNELKGNDKD